MATLSACIITKNEAHLLAKALESIRAHVDEIVVVDTGPSTDGTKALCEEYSCKYVVCTDYNDEHGLNDFAGARNVSIDHATSDWCMKVDSDWVMPARSMRMIRAFCDGNHNYAGALIPIYEATAHVSPDEVFAGKHEGKPSLSMSVFIRQARYSGRVHEEVTPWLEAEGYEYTAIEAKVAHYGNVDARPQRDGRNERLLKLMIVEDPANTLAVGYLAAAYFKAGQLQDCCTLIDQTMKQPFKGRDMYRIGIVRAGLCIAYGYHDEALKTLDMVHRLYGEHPDCDFFAGLAYEQKGDFELALKSYELAMAKDSWNVVMMLCAGASTWNALARSGVCQAALGQVDEARASLELALADPTIPKHHSEWIEKSLAELAEKVAA